MGEQRFLVTPEVVLEETIPIAERIAATPVHYTIKGLFFRPLVHSLGSEWHVLAKQLVAPPDGDYDLFGDYPQVDHARLAVAAAKKQFPDVSVREALRRVERSAPSTFAQSSTGKFFMSLATDPSAAFRVLPAAYRHIQSGGEMRSLPRRSGVRMELREFAPWLDCSVVGAFEGIVVLFGRRPTIDVTLRSPSDADFDIEWR